MADEAVEEQQEEKKSGPGWLVAILMGVAGLGAGFGASMALMPNMVSAQASDEEMMEKEEVPSEVPFNERVHTLDPFVVNVSGEGYPRYIKVQVALEMDTPEALEGLTQRITQIRDLTILLLSSKRLSDVEGFEGKALLKDDMRERINALLEVGQVQSVLFTEFVVQ